MARGELVVPEALQNPEVLAVLRRAAAAHNIPLAMLKVGNARNSINPNTGAAEFGVLGGVNVDWNKAMGYVAEKFEKEKRSAIVLPPGGASLAPTISPSDSDLEFNPNGPNLWNLVKSDPTGAGLALWHGLRARQEAQDRYEGGPAEVTLQQGEGDAWRHARWNQRMASSIGAERAKSFADWNERMYGESNPTGDRAMDLYNNQVGRNLPGDTSKLTIDELVRSGRLRTAPY